MAGHLSFKTTLYGLVSLLFFDLKFINNPVKGFFADLLEDNLPDGVVRIARCSSGNFGKKLNFIVIV
jgi:hypothetical protein